MVLLPFLRVLPIRAAVKAHNLQAASPYIGGDLYIASTVLHNKSVFEDPNAAVMLTSRAPDDRQIILLWVAHLYAFFRDQ